MQNSPHGETVVSVVIPCYQQAHFLGAAIESVQQQTHPRCEIIIVDDGSPDDTYRVTKNYPDVLYTRQRNQGLSASRNTGFQQSNGKFLVFLDADDRLLPEAISQGLACFAAHPECALVSGHYRLIDKAGHPRERFPQRPLEGDAYTTLLVRNYIGMNAAVMYRREAFQASGGFDASLVSCEDYELYMRLARSYQVATHPAIVAEYRTYENSMSMDPSRMIRGVLQVFRLQWPIIQGNPEYLRSYQAGILGNAKQAYRPLLGAIRRALKRGDYADVFMLSLRLAKHPGLLPQAFLLRRRAASALSKCASGRTNVRCPARMGQR